MTEHDPIQRPLEILILSAKHETALVDLVGRYADFMSNPQVSLGDICYTAGVGRSHFEERVGVVCRTIEEAQKKLKAFSSGEKTSGIIRGRLAAGGNTPKIAFLFTGQGSQ